MTIKQQSSLDEMTEIRNNTECLYDIVQAEKPQRKRLLADADIEAFRQRLLSFKADICFRGPSACIQKMLSQYSAYCKIKNAQTFDGGITQVYAYIALDHQTCVFEIMKSHPSLRVTCFASIGYWNCVLYSETGAPGFTKAEKLDDAKDEGGHWMHSADVLKNGNYRCFDTFSGNQWTVNYRFPFLKEWEKDQYIVTENDKLYLVTPKRALAAQGKQITEITSPDAPQVDFVVVKGVLKKYKGKETEVVVPEGITHIGKSAFAKQKKLTSIFIPEGVVEIGESAFSACENLISVTLASSIVRIASHAFSECSALTNIVIPDNVTSIGEGAFAGCKNLAHLVLSKGLEEIGAEAFVSCAISQLHIPQRITKIPDGMCNACRNLTTVVFHEGIKQIGKGAFAYCKMLTNAILPTSVTSIGDEAFRSCSLERVEVPHGVRKIGRYTFANPMLKSIVLPNTVTGIAAFAFYGCTSLEAIAIPDSTTNIGEKAFEGCDKLVNIILPPSVIKLGKDLFLKTSDDLTVTVAAGSYAEQYCLEYDIHHICIG